MSNLIRKLKISEIVPVEFTESELKIVKLFDDNLKDLTIFIQDEYPNHVNYMKPDGSWLFQIELNDKIFVDYNFYESLLKLNSNYDQIQLLIMYMVERILKIKVYKLMKLLVKPDGIESSYKLKNESNTKA